MRIWCSALACVAFVIKHILWQHFVSTPTQALLGFWIQWVQVKGMLHNVGGGVKLGSGPVWAKQGQKNVGTRVVREWSQKLLAATCHIHQQWTCSWLKIHIFHFHVFGPLKEHFCMKCFNTDVQVQLDSRVWPSRLNRGSYCQDVYNLIMLWDTYRSRQGYFVVECVNVLLHSWNEVVLQNLWCRAFQNSILPMCMYLYMSAHPKIQSSWSSFMIKLICSELLVCT